MVRPFENRTGFQMVGPYREAPFENRTIPQPDINRPFKNRTSPVFGWLLYLKSVVAPFQVRHSRVEIDAKNCKNDEKRSAILKSLKDLVATLQSIDSSTEENQIDQVWFIIIFKNCLSNSNHQNTGLVQYLNTGTTRKLYSENRTTFENRTFQS